MAGLLMAVVTGSTCADACWYAREDVCRCSCGGANHGVLKDGDGAERPARTKRMRNKRYELVGVAIGYGNAYRTIRDMGLRETYTREYDNVGDCHVQSVPADKFGKWRELDGFEPNRRFQEHPHFIWKRVS